MKEVPQHPKKRHTQSPILRADIENAQAHTNSNAAAARFLNVPYARYKKYAELYGIFERHLNLTGIGVDKGYSKRPTSIPLREILEGKHPTYSIAKLKNRLVARGKLTEECSLCGFHERRVTDKKVPLMLSFKDGDKTHRALDNLELLCYNCMFLTTGAPSVVYRKGIKRSLQGIPAHTQMDPIPADARDREDFEDNVQWDVTLTDEERAQLLQDLDE